MIKALGLLFMVMLSLNSLADGNSAEKVKSALSDYAWEKRQLIVFSPSIEHKQYQVFKKVEAEFAEEFEDRKLHTWHVIANNAIRLNSTERAVMKTDIVSDITSQDFRESYNVSKNEFRLLLIGYDQGEKLRQKEVNIDYLFSEIDQMPMRIQEMK